MMKNYIIIFFISFGFVSAVYAEGAGLKVNYKNVKVSITYNDNVDDQISGVEYIRQPSGALFDIIFLLQKNAASFDSLNKDIQANIDNHGGNLSIYQEEEPTSVLLRENNIKNLNNKALRSSICTELKIKDCSINNDATVDLYLSDSYVNDSETDLIDFGCFPCKNNKTITLTNRYSPVKNNSYPPKFKKVPVNRQTIYHYFNLLRN